jgi:hypothetical protein
LFPNLRRVAPRQGPSEDEVRQRIAALKARRPATTSSDSDFYFDPTELRRLIDPGKLPQTINQTASPQERYHAE